MTRGGTPGRPKKDAHTLTVYLRKDIYDDFTSFCEDKGHTKTLAAERAITSYMKNGNNVPVTLRPDVYVQLSNFCSKRHLDADALMEQAITGYMSAVEQSELSAHVTQ